MPAKDYKGRTLSPETKNRKKAKNGAGEQKKRIHGRGDKGTEGIENVAGGGKLRGEEKKENNRLGRRGV